MKKSDNSEELETGGIPYPSQMPDREKNAGKRMFRQGTGNPFHWLPNTDSHDLNDYIQHKPNYDIYEEFDNKNGIYFELFDPLEFFNLFYTQIALIEDNKFKPTFITQNLKNLNLTDRQNYFLYEKLLNYFSDRKNDDEQLNICCREIVKLQRNLDVQIQIKPGNSPDPKPSYPTERSIAEQNLDDFLVSKFNLKIYQNLTEGEEKSFFSEPIDFFRLFYGQLEFIEKNPSKPLEFVSNINQLPIGEHQRRILFYYINEMLSKVFDEYSNEQIKVCQILIESEYNKLDEKLFPEKAGQTEVVKNIENYFDFEFDLVKGHLKTLPDDKAKIIYLIEAKTDYEQQRFKYEFESPTFDQKCELEIEKLTKLSQLKTIPEQKEISAKDAIQTNEKIGEREAKQKALGLTQDRAVWAMNYLFTAAKVNCHNTEKAKFISFLTGFSEAKIAQSFSRIEKLKLELEEKTEFSKKNSDDYDVIRNLFGILHLTEIQEQIEKDFGN